MRDALVTYVPAAALVVLAFWVAYRFVGPAPPRHLTISAGEDGGAYQIYADRYRAILARTGIELEVLASAGSIENLERVEAGQADLALVQGGTVQAAGLEDASDLRSLGSLFLEPVWVFARSELEIEDAGDLAGRRIAIGDPGGGTRAVALQILAASNVGPQNAELLELDPLEAVAAAEKGEVDAVFAIAAIEAPIVQRLARDPALELLEIRRSEAFTRYHRYLSRVTIPAGLLELKRDVPDRATDVVATAANLVARDDLHPALVDLLITTMDEVHAPGGLIERRGEFPSTHYLVLPLDAEAERRYRYGPSFLQRYLPFWAATFIDRIKVMLLPVLALLLPLVRVLPPVYQWRIRSRIYRWYGDLDRLDPEPEAVLDADEIRSRLDELLDVEREVRKVQAPLSYGEKVYDLRVHVDLVGAKLRARLAALQGAGGEAGDG